MKKAIAYVSDVILGRTGEVIGRDHQKEMINRFAAENGVEIVAWFEDEAYSEDILSRPGVRQLMACDLEHDGILVERVWAFSRSWTLLQPFLADLKEDGQNLQSATQLWDCVSQQTRDFYRGRSLKPLPASCEVASGARSKKRAKVAKPATSHFAGLVGRAAVKHHA